MASREDLQKRLLATFREEAAEHVDMLERELGVLASTTSASDAKARLETLFRVMHTLKGAARSVRFSEIEDVCQKSEGLLRIITQGEARLSQADMTSLGQATERLRELVFGKEGKSKSAPPTGAGDLEKAGTDTPAPRESQSVDVRIADGRSPAAGQERSGDEPREEAGGLPIESVRVDIGRLDRLMLVAENLLLPSLVVSERARTARRMMDDVSALRGRIRAARASRSGGEAVKWDHDNHASLLDSLRDIEVKSRRLAIALDDDQRTLRIAVNDLFVETRQARMLPAATMLAAFPSMVRDLCRETGKQAKWRLKESGVELDRKVIELVKNPLIHLVRNAIDHGIEPPDEREAAGKPRRGRITVSIQPMDGGRVAIEIIDDGRGMNAPALRDAAVRSRIASASQVQALSDSDIIDIAFRPGVSTSAVITNISGLGLGLSIVREQVERIDGRIIVRSTLGEGTTIRLELPATIASYRGLLVSVGNCRLLCPAESVERVIGISKSAATTAVQAGVIALGEEMLPFGRLGAVVGVRSAGSANNDRHLESCVVMSSGSRRAVLMVDEILGEMDVLIKDLPLPLKRVRSIASAGLLATGEMALVIRPTDVLTAINTTRAESEHLDEPSVGRTMRVLVVDDSITTRTMERNLLEAAGYSVYVAADGLEAWSMLQSESIDLVVSDIDMPRMNGFELTAKIRGDSRLSELPIVLVTALESRDDKERGIRIGANAYVLKSAFDQSNLLEIVGRLI